MYTNRLMRKAKNDEGIGISRKLYTNITAVFLASILLITFMVFFFMRMYLLWQEQTAADKLLEQICVEFEHVFGEAEKLCYIIGKNYDVQEVLRVPASNDFAYNAKERTDINGKIAQITQSFTTNINNIGLFLEDGRRFKYGIFSAGSEDFRSSDWYQRFLNTENFEWIGVYDTSQALHSLEWKCLVGGMSLTNMRNNEVCGVILVETSYATITGIIDRWASENTSIELMDPETDQLLYRAGSEDLTPQATSERRFSEHFTIRIRVNELTMLDDFAKLLLLYASLSIVGFLLMMKRSAKSLKKTIVKPIETLLCTLDSFENENLDVNIKINSDIAEIRRLVNGVDDLFARIRLLIHTREEGQKIIRRAQVAALQEQINPHFLYNTMDSISWLIRTDEKEKALKTLYNFATLFRLSLNNGRNYVTLAEELNYIRYYIDVLNVRYNNQISYAISVDDDALVKYFLPKLVLQPLVENSIEHGIAMRDSQTGHIDIRIFRENAGTCIEVTDNGVGIEGDLLREINDLLENGESPGGKSHKSYGIFNVNSRFKVAYGKAYGISFESVYGAYTKVRMNAPLCNTRGEIIND